jgi:hypothetical protein
MLSTLNGHGVRTAFQLKVYAPNLYRQYVGSKKLLSDFHLGPLYAHIGPQSKCRPLKTADPICAIIPGSTVQDAAKSAAACAQSQRDANAAAKIAAQTALQIGAGKQDAELILSTIGDGLNLNAAQRNRLANDFSTLSCISVCNVPTYSPICLIPPEINVLEAARLSGKCAARFPENAARIIAETMVVFSKSDEDSALILAGVIKALNLDGNEQSQLTRNVAALNCTIVSPDLLISPASGASQDKHTEPVETIEDTNIIHILPGPVSPN